MQNSFYWKQMEIASVWIFNSLTIYKNNIKNCRLILQGTGLNQQVSRENL